MQATRLIRSVLSPRSTALVAAAFTLTVHAQPVPEGRRLRDIAQEAGLYLGTTLNSGYATLSDTVPYQAVAVREFDIFTLENEMKMRRIRPTSTTFDWSVTDPATQLALNHGGDMHFHFLVGGPSKYAPDWMKAMANDPAVTATQFRNMMKTHISTIMDHWPQNGNMKMWEVTNEMFRYSLTTPVAGGNWKAGLCAPGTADPEDMFRKKLGDNYLEEAFREAALHKAPLDILMYNDNNTELLSVKSDHVYAMVQDFTNPNRAGGVVPITAIGFQCHMKDQDYDWSSLRQNFDRFSALGMELFITEMDWRITVGVGTETTANLFDKQGRNYHNFFDAVLRSPGFGGAKIWGFTDQYTWVGSETMPLLFDANYNPKPSYYAIQDALEMQQRDQVMANPGFETALAGNWTPSGATLTFTTAAGAHSGTRALKVSGRANPWSGPQQDVTTTLKNRGAGRYYLRAWARVPAGTANVKLTLRLDDSGATPVYFSTGVQTVGTTWTRVSGWINVSWFKQLNTATLYAETTAGTTDFFLDDVHLGDGNLVANDTFENNLTNWLAKGTATLGSTSATTGAFTYHYGAKAVRVTARATDWAGASQNMLAALLASGPGEYNLSAYMKLFSGTGTGKLTLRLKVNGVNQYLAVSDTIKAASWTRLSNLINVNWTGTLEEAELYIETPGSTTSYYLDDVILRPKKTP